MYFTIIILGVPIWAVLTRNFIHSCKDIRLVFKSAIVVTALSIGTNRSKLFWTELKSKHLYDFHIKNITDLWSVYRLYG